MQFSIKKQNKQIKKEKKNNNKKQWMEFNCEN